MGNIIIMSRRRRTYKNHAGEPEYADQPANPEADPGFPTPAPQRSNWLRTALTIAGSAVLGAVAIDFYRKLKSPSVRNDGGDDFDGEGGAPSMLSAAVPGAPTIMPMPMPVPMPMPMPMMPNYGYGGYGGPPPPPAAAPAPAPMTGQERIELARLEAEANKSRESLERLRMWEDGDLD